MPSKSLTYGSRDSIGTGFACNCIRGWVTSVLNIGHVLIDGSSTIRNSEMNRFSQDYKNVIFFENSNSLPTKSDKLMISVLFSTVLNMKPYFFKQFLAEDFGIWVTYTPFRFKRYYLFHNFLLIKSSKN